MSVDVAVTETPSNELATRTADNLARLESARKSHEDIRAKDISALVGPEQKTLNRVPVVLG